MPDTSSLLEAPRRFNLLETACTPTSSRTLDLTSLLATQLPPVDHVLVVASVLALGTGVREAPHCHVTNRAPLHRFCCSWCGRRFRAADVVQTILTVDQVIL